MDDRTQKDEEYDLINLEFVSGILTNTGKLIRGKQPIKLGKMGKGGFPSQEEIVSDLVYAPQRISRRDHHGSFGQPLVRFITEPNIGRDISNGLKDLTWKIVDYLRLLVPIEDQHKIIGPFEQTEVLQIIHELQKMEDWATGFSTGLREAMLFENHLNPVDGTSVPDPIQSRLRVDFPKLQRLLLDVLNMKGLTLSIRPKTRSEEFEQRIAREIVERTEGFPNNNLELQVLLLRNAGFKVELVKDEPSTYKVFPKA